MSSHITSLVPNPKCKRREHPILSCFNFLLCVMDLQFPFSLATYLILLFFLFKLVKQHQRSKHQNPIPKLPPGPWKLPLIGNTHNLAMAGSLPHRALRDLANKYGPLMHLQIGENSTVVVSSPKLAKEVMKTHDLSFLNRPELLGFNVMSYNNLDIVVSPYGDYWRQMRKICTLELLSTKNVRSFCSIREDEVFQLIKSIHSSSSSSGSPINLTDKIFTLSNAIISRAAFGMKWRDQDTLIPSIKEAISLVTAFDLSVLFPSWKLLHVISGIKGKLVKAHKKIDDLFDNIINEHREKNFLSSNRGNGESGVEDLVDVLLRLMDNKGLEFPITVDNIKAILMDMFIGGTETSSTVVDWAMSELIKNPSMMEKAQSELRQTHKGKKTINETDIQDLVYLKKVIKETLRMHPPAPLLLPRECREQCQINGYDIPVKTKIVVNAWALARDPEFWHNAESFEPERFDNSSVDFIGTNFEFIPFGAGRRICPGMSFGIANVELPLAQLLYHFNWELPNGTKPEELDMIETFGSSARRRKNLYLIATPYTP